MRMARCVLHFALYINDLPSVVKHCILDLYADDAESHCSHSDLRMVETYLQSDLDSVAVWLLSSHLCLNVAIVCSLEVVKEWQIRSCVSLLVVMY